MFDFSQRVLLLTGAAAASAAAIAREFAEAGANVVLADIAMQAGGGIRRASLDPAARQTAAVKLDASNHRRCRARHRDSASSASAGSTIW